MGYADYQTSGAYAAKQAGAFHSVVLQNEADATDKLVGATTGISWNEDYEGIPVEEMGNDGVDEHVDGRMTVSGSFTMNASSQRLDAMPTRQDFIGKRYTITQQVAKSADSTAIGTVVWVCTKCKITGISGQNAARGIQTLSVNFVGSRRYSGAEWADLTGAM
ncbi:MAG: hypothetical protein WC911_01955 [Thermoleophilia bacterium]